jgi:hypothetical protein
MFGLSDAEVKAVHANLENTAARQLALIHKTIVNAYISTGDEDNERRSKGGSFWRQIGKDEIHWWVFKKERDLEGWRKSS